MSFLLTVAERDQTFQLPPREIHESVNNEEATAASTIERIKRILPENPSHLFRIDNLKLRTNDVKGIISSPDYTNAKGEDGKRISAVFSKSDKGCSLFSLQGLLMRPAPGGQVFISPEIDRENPDELGFKKLPNLLKLQQDDAEHFSLCLTENNVTKDNLNQTLTDYGSGHFIDTGVNMTNVPQIDRANKDESLVGRIRFITDKLLESTTLQNKYSPIYDQIQRINGIVNEYIPPIVQDEDQVANEMGQLPEGMMEQLVENTNSSVQREATVEFQQLLEKDNLELSNHY